ncbi:MAG: glycine cleavage system protein H [SAR202 cluster bacterium Io17-Chloro-G7]|nr:MAG: glycine cleavage system protein H [SAR202 cluster bacterium Io17-Chloro-G7]
MNPSDRKYSREHEWLKVEDADASRAVAGITDYAQEQLGDVVFVELPKLGATVKFMGKMGEIESVKSVSDLFSPVSGEVIEINIGLLDNPEIANKDPFGEGWLIKVTMSDASELDNLLTAEEYETFTSGLS